MVSTLRHPSSWTIELFILCSKEDSTICAFDLLGLIDTCHFLESMRWLVPV